MRRKISPHKIKEKQMANIFIKNIVPTDIAMVYGILEKNLKY